MWCSIGSIVRPYTVFQPEENPRVLKHVASTNSKNLFVLTILVYIFLMRKHNQISTIKILKNLVSRCGSLLCVSKLISGRFVSKCNTAVSSALSFLNRHPVSSFFRGLSLFTLEMPCKVQKKALLKQTVTVTSIGSVVEFAMKID